MILTVRIAKYTLTKCFYFHHSSLFRILTEPYGTLDEIAEYFDSADFSKERFLSGDWTEPIFTTIHFYLSTFGECEANPNFGQCSVIETSSYCKNYNEGNDRIREYLEQKLMELKVSVYELKAIFAYKIANIFSFSVDHSWTANNGTEMKSTIRQRY